MHALVRSWRVGRFTCRMTVPADLAPGDTATAEIEWIPYLPESMSDFESMQYRRGRDRAMDELGLEFRNAR